MPGGEHVHDHCDEHFEVRAGQITFVADGEERTLGAGEELTVPAGTWHRWWNPGREEVRLRTRVEPALDFERAIMVLWGLCADGHVDEQGRPSPAARLAAGHALPPRDPLPPAARPRCSGCCSPPWPSWRAVAAWSKTIERYLDPDTHPSAQTGPRAAA